MTPQPLRVVSARLRGSAGPGLGGRPRLPRLIPPDSLYERSNSGPETIEIVAPAGTAIGQIRACLRVPPSCAPELGAAARERLRHRPRTMPELRRLVEDHRRHHRCAGDRAHPDPSGPLRARPTTLVGKGAGPASRGLTSAQPIPVDRTDAPPRCRLCLGLASAAQGTPGPALAGRLTRSPDSDRPQRGDLHRGKHGAEPPDQSQRHSAAFKLDRKGFEFPSAAAGRN